MKVRLGRPALVAAGVVAVSLFLMLCMAFYGREDYLSPERILARADALRFRIASLVVEPLGAGGFLAVGLLLAWGVIAYFRESIGAAVPRAVGFAAVVPSFCALHSLGSSSQDFWAGSLGIWAGDVLHRGFGPVAAWAVTGLLFAVSLLLATEFGFVRHLRAMRGSLAFPMMPPEGGLVAVLEAPVAPPQRAVRTLEDVVVPDALPGDFGGADAAPADVRVLDREEHLADVRGRIARREPVTDEERRLVGAEPPVPDLPAPASSAEAPALEIPAVPDLPSFLSAPSFLATPSFLAATEPPDPLVAEVRPFSPPPPAPLPVDDFPLSHAREIPPEVIRAATSSTEEFTPGERARAVEPPIVDRAPDLFADVEFLPPSDELAEVSPPPSLLPEDSPVACFAPPEPPVPGPVVPATLADAPSSRSPALPGVPGGPPASLEEESFLDAGGLVFEDELFAFGLGGEAAAPPPAVPGPLPAPILEAAPAAAPADPVAEDAPMAQSISLPDFLDFSPALPASEAAPAEDLSSVFSFPGEPAPTPAPAPVPAGDPEPSAAAALPGVPWGPPAPGPSVAHAPSLLFADPFWETPPHPAPASPREPAPAPVLEVPAPGPAPADDSLAALFGDPVACASAAQGLVVETPGAPPEGGLDLSPGPVRTQPDEPHKAEGPPEGSPLSDGERVMLLEDPEIGPEAAVSHGSVAEDEELLVAPPPLVMEETPAPAPEDALPGPAADAPPDAYLEDAADAIVRSLRAVFGEVPGAETASAAGPVAEMMQDRAEEVAVDFGNGGRGELRPYNLAPGPTKPEAEPPATVMESPPSAASAAAGGESAAPAAEAKPEAKARKPRRRRSPRPLEPVLEEEPAVLPPEEDPAPAPAPLASLPSEDAAPEAPPLDLDRIERLVEKFKDDGSAPSDVVGAGFTPPAFAGEPAEDAREKFAVPAGEDDLYEEATRTVRERGRGSVVVLQRRLGIGYTRAVRILAALVSRGVLGPENETGAHPVL